MTSKQPGVSWVYELNKNEIINKLKELNVDFDERDTLNNLRKLLVNILRGEAQIEDKDSQGAKVKLEFPCKNLRIMEKSSMTFKLNVDDWDTFIERLELYFSVYDIDESKYVPELLTKVSSETYILIRNLVTPKKPKELTFKELVSLMSNHLNPKSSELIERHKFNNSVQTSSETIAEYVARLKQVSLKCKFTDLDTSLRDQFVCGVYNQETRMELFRQENLSFVNAVKIAELREMAIKSVTLTCGTSTNTGNELNYFSGSPSRHNIAQRESKPPNFDFNKNKKTLSARGVSKDNVARSNSNTSRNIKCYCCGALNSHFASTCFHRFKECSYCKVKGHLERACLKKQNQSSKRNFNFVVGETNMNESVEHEPDTNECDFFHFEELNKKQTVNISSDIEADPLLIDLIVNGVKIRMQVDTGSYVTVISENIYNKYFTRFKLTDPDLTLMTYGKNDLHPIGILKDLKVIYNSKKELNGMKCYVLPGNGPSLMGRSWLKLLNLWPLKVDLNFCQPKSVTSDDFMKELKNKFPNLFSATPGVFNGRKIKLVFKENTVPVQMKPHRVPFALKDKVRNEIKRLISLGNLEPVNVSSWATPIVPVLKANGEVRICGNFKLTVNPNLIIKRQPLPTKEEIFCKLQAGNKWSQIDLAHAFMQFGVDDSSKDALTIITDEGLFRYLKMPEGVASSPGECQEILMGLLKDIPYTEVYIDNIYCTGRTDEEHISIMMEIFRRLNNCGLRVNEKKCDLFKSKLEILGFVLDTDGIHPAESKIKAVRDAPRPQDTKQLKSFLGLVNYYECFLKDRADKLMSLYELLKSPKWYWSKECEESFTWIKRQIISDNVLTIFDPNKQLILSCDASYYGLSAILSHKFENGEEKPVAFASKIIPTNERHRAIIDKEAAAIIFGFKKFYQYVYGAEIILRTDHEPLKYIFGNYKNLSITIQNRLQRWAYFLSGFTYKIEIVRSSSNGNCDALSRLPLPDSTPVFDSELSTLNYIAEGMPTLNFKLVAKETVKDKVLCKILNWIVSGWPSESKNMSDIEKTFFSKKLELSLDKGCLLWGVRVIIPQSLQSVVMKHLHTTHFGSTRMKQLARSYFWWPNLNMDIEAVANTCEVCVANRRNPAKISNSQWPYPSKAWSRLHADFLGPVQNRMFLIIIDAHSKWPEVFEMNNTRAERVIQIFKQLFVRYGLCDHLVTDGGPQFTSQEFKNFLTNNGVLHTVSPPRHPATNGAAENFVGTFKEKIYKMLKSGHTLESAIDNFLLDYRRTEHGITGRSPSFLMFGREIKTKYDLLKPNVIPHVEFKQCQLLQNNQSSRSVEFHINEPVMIDDHRVSARNKRTTGKIIKRLSPVTYLVKFHDGLVCKRHVDQMLKFSENALSPTKNEMESERTQEEEQIADNIRKSERLKGKKPINYAALLRGKHFI